MSADRRSRGGLRDLNRHASWREVYYALGVETDQHGTEVSDEPESEAVSDGA